MNRAHREGERVLLEMGFKILETGHGRHRWWLLETPSGKRFKHPIPSNVSERRFWLNWRMQLRRHLHNG